MNQFIIAPTLALVMSQAAVSPAMAVSVGGAPPYSSHGIIAVLLGWFLPAVQ
jgi:hypothetical protein